MKAISSIWQGAITAAALAACSVSAQAANSINLGNYLVTGNYALDVLNGTNGGISGLEASAVAYSRDSGTLFFVGDEGTGVVEISRTGQTLSNMTFNWASTGSTKHDTEGLTYVGNGKFVVSEERLYDAYSFTYAGGGVANLAASSVSISNANVGNSGLEGISYDPRNGGSFVTVKQEGPEDILAGTLTFANGGGVATMSQLFNPTLLGLSTLSDVQALATVDALAGTAAADNLLILSLGSQKLLEVTRTGLILSSLDLSAISPHNAIEGVTIDEKGVIYLVAEQEQDGSTLTPHSRLIELTAAVPEPETYGLALTALGVLGVAARRQKKA
jgi:uncharacterized protein YjiK